MASPPILQRRVVPSSEVGVNGQTRAGQGGSTNSLLINRQDHHSPDTLNMSVSSNLQCMLAAATAETSRYLLVVGGIGDGRFQRH